MRARVRFALAAIGILCSDPTGGVAHYRAGSLGEVLRARGHTVVVSDQGRTTPAGSVALMMAGTDDPRGAIGWEPDVVILTGGWPSAAPLEMLDEARAEGQRVVLDIDDSLELPVHNYHYNPELKRAKLTAAAHASALLVSTRPLRRELRRARVRVPVEVSRNVVDPLRFAGVNVLNTARARRYERENPSPVVIGYRGSVPHHRGDVAMLCNALGSLAGRLDVRFVHIGAHPDDPHAFAHAVGVREELVTAREWQPFGAYPPLLTGIDIAVVPLGNDAFSRAKSNIAGLEWSAAGVAFIAQWNEAYAELVVDPPLVRTAGEWPHALERMLDPTTRGVARMTQELELERWTTANAIGADTHPVEELLGRLDVPEAQGCAPGISPGAREVEGGATPANAPQGSPQPGDNRK